MTNEIEQARKKRQERERAKCKSRGQHRRPFEGGLGLLTMLGCVTLCALAIKLIMWAIL